MKKNALLTILLVFLMVMNAVLVYLIWNKPDKRMRPPRNFITNQLDFDPGQESEFLEIDRIHHLKMRRIDDQSRDLKEILFSSMGDAAFTDAKLDSITNLIGTLSQAREKEVFSYFRQIESICNEEQKITLQGIVRNALRHGPRPPGPPRHK